MIRPVAMVFAEGFLDRLAAERLVLAVGSTVEGTSSDAGGRDAFWRTIPRYNAAAPHLGLILALADHDSRECVGPRLKATLPHHHANLILRLSVPMLEAWLLADRTALAGFLHVPVAALPDDPDAVEHPKREVVNIARRSTRRQIREGMAPAPGRGGLCGPLYTPTVEAFIASAWDPLRAAKRSPSLHRALRALRTATRSAT
ncbi:MAG: DUF4276 family protein [Planctomycetaceae bacterium]|nr:hypothetical protein [Phycisphaerales bacterium]MCE2653805.1 DUF4276 family protein [Planctomycetaceae bacterium]